MSQEKREEMLREKLNMKLPQPVNQQKELTEKAELHMPANVISESKKKALEKELQRLKEISDNTIDVIREGSETAINFSKPKEFEAYSHLVKAATDLQREIRETYKDYYEDETKKDGDTVNNNLVITDSRQLIDLIKQKTGE